MLFTGTCNSPQVLQFLRNAVWHYRRLDSRPAEEPVKDISAKKEDVVSLTASGSFSIADTA